MESSVCPICGQTATESLEGQLSHLNSHSKEDLIRLVLRQQKEEKLPVTSSAAKTSKSFAGSEHEPQPQDANAVCLGSLQLPHSSRSLTNLEPVSIQGGKSENCPAGYSSIGIVEDDADDGGVGYGLVPVATFTVPFPLNEDKEVDNDHSYETSSVGSLGVAKCEPSEEKAESENPAAQDDQASGHDHIAEAYQDNSLASSGTSEDSRSNELVQGESDNATSQTSIIKYIIDQRKKSNNEQPEAERWILPDGRGIPVYSSFTQLPIVAKSSNSDASKIREENGTNLILERVLQLNLMADEEIPPRGEISEYEESNTSLVSEDSKLAISMDSKQGLTSLTSDLLLASKRSGKQKGRGKQAQQSDNQPHQFLCYECPTVQKFKSLFELIGHKVKIHPSTTQGFTDRDQASSSVPVFEVPQPREVKAVPGDTKSKTPKEFFCVYCTSTFSHRVELSIHMEIDHNDKPAQPSIFECNTCGKTFPARTNLRKHLLVHKERKYVCSICSKGFTSNFKLMEHARVHTKREGHPYPYKCETCGKDYRTPSLLNHHMKTVHVPEADRPVKPKIELFCGTCHKVLRSKRSYLCHIKSHRSTPKKCPFCCETFGRQSVLVRHIRVTHDPQYESSESKDCPVCQKKLHPNSMIKHMRIHADEKPYSCQVCEKRFRTYANLSSHSWSHTNIDKPFKCKSCPKSYLFKRTLEHHMLVHKRRTLHYVCNECGVRFTNKVNMKRHLEEHYSEKKYKCKTCGKAFQRNYYLLEHERIHSGLKPFICNICGKASTTKSNHRAHVKIHDARDAGSQEG